MSEGRVERRKVATARRSSHHTETTLRARAQEPPPQTAPARRRQRARPAHRGHPPRPRPARRAPQLETLRAPGAARGNRRARWPGAGGRRAAGRRGSCGALGHACRREAQATRRPLLRGRGRLTGKWRARPRSLLTGRARSHAVAWRCGLAGALSCGTKWGGRRAVGKARGRGAPPAQPLMNQTHTRGVRRTTHTQGERDTYGGNSTRSACSYTWWSRKPVRRHACRVVRGHSTASYGEIFVSRAWRALGALRTGTAAGWRVDDAAVAWESRRGEERKGRGPASNVRGQAASPGNPAWSVQRRWDL